MISTNIKLNSRLIETRDAIEQIFLQHNQCSEYIFFNRILGKGPTFEWRQAWNATQWEFVSERRARARGTSKCLRD